MEESQSETSIVCINEKSKFFIFDEDSDSFEQESIIDFVNDFKLGKLMPYIKSETIPKNNNKNLKKIVGKTIENFIKTPNKHVILALIGYDTSFEKNLAKLANKYANNKNLIFGKIDINLNDIPENFDSRAANLYFISAENKNQPIRNENGKNLEEMVDFVEKNLQNVVSKHNDKLEL